jgi:hypothetical protein
MSEMRAMTSASQACGSNFAFCRSVCGLSRSRRSVSIVSPGSATAIWMLFRWRTPPTSDLLVVPVSRRLIVASLFPKAARNAYAALTLAREAAQAQARVLRDAIAGGGAEPGAGGSDGDRVGCSVLHEEPHLVIGHVAAGHERSSEAEKAPA